MEDWKEYRLDELYVFGNGLSKGSKYFGYGHPFVSFKTVFNNYFLPEELSDYVDSDEKEQTKCSVQKSDVLLTRTSETVNELGYSCVALRDYPKATFNGFCKRMRPITEGIIHDLYAGYYFRSSHFRNQVCSMSNMVTRASLSNEMLGRLTIKLPSYKTQTQIGELLFSIDRKIALNRQINDNLEQQLQALYNEWFVESPKSDWHSVNLSEIATFVSGYSYKGNELVENSDTAMATIKNFERNGGFKIDGYKPIIPSPKLKVDQRAQLFDILVAHTDLTQNAEVIGNAEILLSKDIYKNLIFSMDLVKVNAKESFPFQFLLALLLKNPRFKSHCIGYVNGTTVLHMNKRALPDYETIIPNLEDAQNLNATAMAIFCQMSENLTEISNLTEMRDTLLPRLMSGELKINDLDS